MKNYIQHECLNSLSCFPRWLGVLPSSRPRGLLALSSPSLSFEALAPSADPVLPSGSLTCLDQKQVDKRSGRRSALKALDGASLSLHFGWRSPALVQTISMISPLWARPFVPLGVSLPGHNPAKFSEYTELCVLLDLFFPLFQTWHFLVSKPCIQGWEEGICLKTISSTASSSRRGPSSSSPA